MGQRKGYKQSPEHIARRMEAQRGEKHWNWKGDKATVRTGRSRAARLFPEIGPCIFCGSARSERHHADGDTLNNSPENVVPVCRKCHMLSDGRLREFERLGRSNLGTAVAAAARSRTSKTACPRGHLYAGLNLYTHRDGRRSCRRCLNDYKRAKRAAGKVAS